MLLVRFSIGVERSKKDELLKTLYDFGIEMLKESVHIDTFRDELVSRIYVDCLAPYSRVKMLAEDLETNKNIEPILTY